jgi:hypothetical protein
MNFLRLPPPVDDLNTGSLGNIENFREHLFVVYFH